MPCQLVSACGSPWPPPCASTVPLELVSAGHLADGEDVAGGCANCLQRMDRRALRAVARAEHLHDPLAWVQVQRLDLEPRRLPGRQRLLRMAEAVAEVLQRGLQARLHKLRLVD